MNLNKVIKDYNLYKQKENSILAENYYGYDFKKKKEVYIKVINNKKIPDPSIIRQHLLNEVMIHDQLRLKNSKNVMCLIDHVQTENNVYLIYTNYKYETMKEFLNYKQMISEKECINYFIQIYYGYCESFSQKVNFRDFTLNNILIGEDDNIRIDDFGLFKFLFNQKNSSLQYRINEAPETQNDRNLYTREKSDSWSLGIILYELLFLSDPYFQQGLITQEMASFLYALLSIDPSKRISWVQILSHPCEKKKEDWNMQLSVFLNPQSANLASRYPEQALATNLQDNSAQNKNQNNMQGVQNQQNQQTSNQDLQNSKQLNKYPTLNPQQNQSAQSKLQQSIPNNQQIAGNLDANYEKFLLNANESIQRQSQISITKGNQQNQTQNISQSAQLQNQNNTKTEQKYPQMQKSVQTQPGTQNQGKFEDMNASQQQRYPKLSADNTNKQQQNQQNQFLQQNQQQYVQTQQLNQPQSYGQMQQSGQINKYPQMGNIGDKINDQKYPQINQNNSGQNQYQQQQQQQQYQQNKQPHLLNNYQNNNQNSNQNNNLNKGQMNTQQQNQQQNSSQNPNNNSQDMNDWTIIKAEDKKVQQNVAVIGSNDVDDFNMQQGGDIKLMATESVFLVKKKQKIEFINKQSKKKQIGQQQQLFNQLKQNQQQNPPQLSEENKLIQQLEQQILFENQRQSLIVQNQQTSNNQQKQPFIQMDVSKKLQDPSPNQPNLNKQQSYQGSQQGMNNQNLQKMQEQPAMQTSLIRGQVENQQDEELKNLINDKQIFDMNVKILQQELDKFNILAQTVERAEDLLQAKNNFWVVICFFILKKLYLIRKELEEQLESYVKVDDSLERWDGFCFSTEFEKFMDKLRKQNEMIYNSLKSLQKLTISKVSKLNPTVSAQIKKHIPLEETEGFPANLYVHLHFHILQMQEASTLQTHDAQVELLKHIIQLQDTLLIVEQGLFVNNDDFFSLQQHNLIQMTSNKSSLQSYRDQKTEKLKIFLQYYRSLGYEL